MAKTTIKHFGRFIVMLGLFALGASSCVKDELPNSECDIEKIIIHYPTPDSLFYRLSDSIIIVPPADNEIKIEVRPDADFSLMRIEYVLTDGASFNNISEYKSDEIKIRTTSEDGNSVTLRGDDGKTNPNIVARAFLSETEAKKISADKWTEINIPFEYLEEIDETRLENRGYSFAMVFTSSFAGGEFSGAVGSTFTIDEVRLICNEDE